MPHAVEVTKPPKQKRLVLCFDGTAKKFAGNASDSNGEQGQYVQTGQSSLIREQS